LAVRPGLGFALKGVPLTIPVYVTGESGVRTLAIKRVKGPVPAVEVNVNCPVPGLQTVFPDNDPCGNGFTVTTNVLGVLAPQLLFAVTDTVPPVVPAVAVIEFVVEVPVHPTGSIQV
jgi:hypothetical protein